MEEGPTPATITHKAMRSVKWSASMEIVSRTASPIVTVILARLLTPTDFGVVATAMIAISFAQMFWDAGLSKALVQTDKAPEDATHVVFWTNVGLGLVIYAILYVTAPWLAAFFNSPETGPVLRVLGLQIVIASLSSVQQALFVRELDFRRLFWVKLITAFVPGIIAIPLAFYGYGVWALVIGSLAGQTLNLVLLWRFSQWRPRLQYDRHLARGMFGFGIWVLAESLGAWLIMWGDNLIVGRFLGIDELGVYRTGWMLVTIIFGLVLNPFLPVLYPTFSRMQNDLPSLKANFHKINRVIISLSLPMGIGLLLLGPEIAHVLFGSQWYGLGLVLSLMGLASGLAWSVGINTELYRAMGRPDINTVLMIVTIVLYMPAYYIAAQFSLEVFLDVRLCLVLVGVVLQVFMCRWMLNVSLFYLWYDGKNFVFASLMMGAGIAISTWGIRFIAPTLPAILELALLITMGVGIYAASLWTLDRAFVLQTSHLIKRAALT